MRIRIFNIYGAPFFVNWTLPVGSIFVSYSFTFDLLESIVISLSYIFIVAIHEIGHAIAAKYVHINIQSIEIYGLGGVCNCTSMPKTKKNKLIFFSSGISAQIIIFTTTIFYTSISNFPVTKIESSIYFVFIYLNLFLIILNLIPGKLATGHSSDGKMILKILRNN